MSSTGEQSTSSTLSRVQPRPRSDQALLACRWRFSRHLVCYQVEIVRESWPGPSQSVTTILTVHGVADYSLPSRPESATKREPSSKSNHFDEDHLLPHDSGYKILHLFREVACQRVRQVQLNLFMTAERLFSAVSLVPSGSNERLLSPAAPLSRVLLLTTSCICCIAGD